MSTIPNDEYTQTKLTTFFLHPERRKRRIEGDTESVPVRSLEASDSSSQISASVVATTLHEQPEPTPFPPNPTRKHSLNGLAKRGMLAQTARETKTMLAGLLKTIPHAAPDGYLYTRPEPPRLLPKYCPGYFPTEVKVLDADTLDTAINVANCAQYITVRDKRPVCVLNMANAHSAGGGWQNGALAQEEALCYRSSLSFTLKLRHYPLSDDQAIYSPTVVVIRDSLNKGHKLLDLTKPNKLPIVSVISVAAIYRPLLEDSEYPPKYKDPRDRELMKDKMRITLRIAAYNGHRRLVLGALGCGAFVNPRQEVADCWVEVLNENEFKGGWWESLIFAVMDDTNEGKNGEGNFGVFYRKLHGTMI
ncbi:DUF2263 domain containing protein [Elaphomyces granulatus]